MKNYLCTYSNNTVKVIILEDAEEKSENKSQLCMSILFSKVFSEIVMINIRINNIIPYVILKKSFILKSKGLQKLELLLYT